MLQVCLFKYCIYFHTYVASVLSRCCVCFATVSSVFQVFLQVFQKHVSNVSLFLDYVAIVASGCFITKSGVASPSSSTAVSPQC
jgi:hypothetical protein